MARILEAEVHVLLEFHQLFRELAQLELRLLELTGHRAELAFEVVHPNREARLVLASAGAAVVVDVGRRALAEILGNLDAGQSRGVSGIRRNGWKQQRASKDQGTAGKPKQHESVPTRISQCCA